ncbi:methylmalonic aciduria and homocystinuria type D homolog, mitochondrial [Microplitis demolitor]|uniref:methylmalonic aciduria and homocystinuria type D homolog, mitochondrial n=1 Tax=Microplitis demolitor TaxID=69319 RepID=UPI0004CD71A2|nr:methylmalonic aciduria and homocystinuria type D homolog, mitochondrial [Microplitis demolitor]
MYCSKIFKQNYSRSINIIFAAKYSRRSAKNTTTYKLVKSNGIDADIDNGELDNNPNWELFGPRGFRFYLPGSIGPGWLDQSTTAQVETRSILLPNNDGELDDSDDFDTHGINDEIINVYKHKNNNRTNNSKNRRKCDQSQPILHCIAQECPMLLRKGIQELFPSSVEAASPQLTIVTITQKLNPRMMRWSKEIETERLAKFFLLAASDICAKLKMFGYWADFINPFSGQPYLNPHKTGVLYKTDERFRCLGFKVNKTNSCKIISHENKGSEFVGSLYTSAPANMDFFKDIMSGMSDH